ISASSSTSSPRLHWRTRSGWRCSASAARSCGPRTCRRPRRVERKAAKGPRPMDRIPIIKMGPALVVSIQGDMHDRLALALEEDLTTMIVTTGAKGVLIDISTLDAVDSFIGRMLDTISAVSRILDAETVVVGMRPSVAITLVELGLSLSGVKTALNVERG